MKCIPEATIERHLLHKATLAPAEQQHIIFCDRCRNRYEFLKELYQELSVEPIEMAPPTAGNVIHLFPNHSLQGFDSTNPRLAAQTATDIHKYSISHFSNEEHDIIGRLLMDRESGKLTLHLISNKEQQIAGQRAILGGANLEAMTDELGVADFGVQPELQCTGIQIQSPIAFFHLTRHEVATIAQSHSLTLQNRNHDEIIIEIEPQEQHNTYKISINKLRGIKQENELRVVALTSKNRLVGSRTDKGISVIETTDHENILKIHIY